VVTLFVRCWAISEEKSKQGISSRAFTLAGNIDLFFKYMSKLCWTLKNDDIVPIAFDQLQT
jgi:hypothetical protein